MKKSLQRTIITLLLALSMVILPLSATGQPMTVQAATVKINKSEISVAKGKTYQLKITGTKKKITWKTFDKSIASVNSKGKVSAKGVGSTVVYGKIGGKYYYCVVNVIEKYSKSSAEKNVTCKHSKVSEESDVYEVAIFKNKNSFPIEISSQTLFYNSSNKIMSTSTDSYSYIPAKSEVAFYIPGPVDDNYKSVSYSKCSILYEVSKSEGSEQSSNVSVSSNKGTSGIIIIAKNNGKTKIDTIEFRIVYYNSSGKIIGCRSTYISNLSAGKTKYAEAQLPGKKYATYKVFLNYAYSY